MTRAEWLTEWLRFAADAQRFGSKDPGQVADILAGPAPAAPCVDARRDDWRSKPYGGEPPNVE